MRTHRTMLVLLACALGWSAAAAFDDDFTGATLRVDYYHTGTADEEHFAVHRMRIEGRWPGSRTQLVDTSNLGKYLVEVVDLQSNRVLYTRGFASIYGEWETTGEAHAGTWRAIQEAVRVPEPRLPFQLRLRKRAADQSFREVWSTTIDPASRFVDRPGQPRGDVLELMVHGDPAVKADLVILGDGYATNKRFDADARRGHVGQRQLAPCPSAVARDGRRQRFGDVGPEHGANHAGFDFHERRLDRAPAVELGVVIKDGTVLRPSLAAVGRLVPQEI